MFLHFAAINRPRPLRRCRFARCRRRRPYEFRFECAVAANFELVVAAVQAHAIGALIALLVDHLVATAASMPTPRLVSVFP